MTVPREQPGPDGEAKGRVSRRAGARKHPTLRAQVALGTLALVVFVPLLAILAIGPVRHAVGADFFATATDVTVGLLVADVLVAGAVVRAFGRRRLDLSDRLQLLVLVGATPLMLGLLLICSLVSIANCGPAGGGQRCTSPAIGPNLSVAVLASGVCLLVAQYLIAFVARR